VIPACYDGLDNDEDGSIDAADSSCWRSDLGFLPSGYGNDEAASAGTGCSDATDEDVDGWIDGADPDCLPGDAEKQTEVGFGTNACNDGIDNDGDEKIDAAETFNCKTASGTTEG
jgi:hypothetical protein